MGNNRFADWAAKHNSGGGRRGGNDNSGGHRGQSAAPLPPAPAGYAWGMHPQMPGTMVLIPLVQPAVQQYAQVPGARQPGAVPYRGPSRVASKPVETCMLVRSADDSYERLLETVPELVPSSAGQYDAMAGTVSPETIQALGRYSEFSSAMAGDLHARPAYGRGAAAGSVGDLAPPAVTAVADSSTQGSES